MMFCKYIILNTSDKCNNNPYRSLMIFRETLGAEIMPAALSPLDFKVELTFTKRLFLFFLVKLNCY